MPQQDGHEKHYLSKRYAIIKYTGENFVMITSIARLSTNRSWARTNQNAKITWAIIYLRHII